MQKGVIQTGLLAGMCAFMINAGAQVAKENTTELSKASRKGILNYASLTPEGNISLNYGMKVDKKSETLNFEDYTFDKDVNFKVMQPSSAPKEMVTKPDYKEVSLYAYAGGSNSFNVLSQKLSLQREEWQLEWNFHKQQYEYVKRISKEIIKPKNGDGKYLGNVKFKSKDGIMIIGSYDPDGKEAEDQFVALYIDMDLNIKETLLTESGNYSLVYTGLLQNGNAFAVMAPNKKMPNINEYIYVEIQPGGSLAKREKFTAPSSNMIVMDYRELNGALFLCCASLNEKRAFNEVFTNYADINNPAMGDSWQSQKYNDDVSKKEMDNFHFLKFNEGKLAFATTVPIKTFKDKVVTPPSQKKAHTYNGKKLFVENMKVLPDGSILMAGQLLNKDVVKGVIEFRYLDIVGFLFNANGELKSQFAVEKMNNDTKSEIWNSDQNFYLSADGKTAYWEILEVKGFKGYNNFWDAYNGIRTYTYNYFPRIAKINLQTGALSDFLVLGSNGKYTMFKRNGLLLAPDGITHYYVGHDEDYEKIWVGKYLFE